jgi:hypothetical protein
MPESFPGRSIEIATAPQGQIFGDAVSKMAHMGELQANPATGEQYWSVQYFLTIEDISTLHANTRLLLPDQGGEKYTQYYLVAFSPENPESEPNVGPNQICILRNGLGANDETTLAGVRYLQGHPTKTNPSGLLWQVEGNARPNARLVQELGDDTHEFQTLDDVQRVITELRERTSHAGELDEKDKVFAKQLNVQLEEASRIIGLVRRKTPQNT